MHAGQTGVASPGNTAVIVGQTGEVELASEDGQRWVDEVGVRDALRVVALGLRSGHAASVAIQLRTQSRALIPVTVVRLVGRMGDRFLVTPCSGDQASPTPPSPRDMLTAAQREVVDLLLTGATLAEIGEALGVSAETVKSHTKNIYARLGVGSRVELSQALKV